MSQKVKITLFSIFFVCSTISLFIFGLPYQSVEATALKWLALAYPEGSSISGVVLFDSEPLEGVQVVLFESVDNEFLIVLSTTTTSSGQYTFNDLELGDYYLGYYGMTPDGDFMYLFHNDKDDLDTADAITISTPSSQIELSSVTLPSPEDPVADVLNNGGGSVYVDPITGQVFVNQPTGNVTMGVENLCAPSDFASASLVYGNLTSYTMTYNSFTDSYFATIPRADMTLQTAEVTVDYTCSTRAEDVVNASEVLGRITQYDPIGRITTALTGAALTGANVKLHQIPGATPDTGSTADGDCRTSDSQTSTWDLLETATVDATEFLVLSDILAGDLADPPVNPQQTASDGYYGWSLEEGCWYVEVVAPGHETVTSPVFGVRSGVDPTDIDLELIPSIKMYAPIMSRTIQ